MRKVPRTKTKFSNWKNYSCKIMIITVMLTLICGYSKELWRYYHLFESISCLPLQHLPLTHLFLLQHQLNRWTKNIVIYIFLSISFFPQHPHIFFVHCFSATSTNFTTTEGEMRNKKKRETKFREGKDKGSRS